MTRNQIATWAFVPAVPLCALAAGLWGWPLIIACAFGWALLGLAISDVRHMILPDWLTLPLVPAGLIEGYIWGGVRALQERSIGAAAGLLLFMAIGQAYRRWRGRDGLGGGDIKLVAGAGAWIGWQGLPVLVLSASLMALAVVAVTGLRGRPICRDQRVPFGAYLCLALWAIWLYGVPSRGW